jgi:hypothetical protein
MSSLSPKDRVSLCQFSFADGRRCRTPRAAKNPHFCFYHAQKEARAQAADTLGNDLAYFFSGNYLSACDLSTALARLIPAVLRGDVKPKTAHTVAYLMQTLLQAIHVSQHEYGEAFGGDGWRKAIFNSVNGNLDYRFPPAPQPESSPSPQPQPQPAQPQTQVQPPVSQPAGTPVDCHSACPDLVGERSEESAFSETQAPLSQTTPAPRPAPAPHTPLPPTADEFVQCVVAGRNLSRPGRETGQKSSPPLTPLEATHTQPPATVDSKPLT